MGRPEIQLLLDNKIDNMIECVCASACVRVLGCVCVCTSVFDDEQFYGRMMWEIVVYSIDLSAKVNLFMDLLLNWISSFGEGQFQPNNCSLSWLLKFNQMNFAHD